jgi:hypothetical protein
VIPRYQRIVFYILLGGSLLMLALIVHGCQRNQQRLAATRDESPIPAPSDLPDEQVTVALANDADGSITLDTLTLPLPPEPSQRARVLLARILANDALPASNHPLPTGPAVSDVFLLSLPVTNPAADNTNTPAGDGRQLAVVNLTKAFAAQHPSGIEVEDLTLRQIIATLQANFGTVDQVRFLIDGQPADTLNGHADLSRAYPVAEPTKSIHVLAADGHAY